MKILLLIILTIVNQITLGQSYNFETNATKRDSSRTLLLDKINGKYDFVLGYTEESYWWSDKQVYKVLAHNKNSWVAFQIISIKNKKGELKTRIIQYDFDADTAKQLLSNLTALGFWKFQRDSLNQEESALNDSLVRKLHIDDGVNYKFEILSNNNYHIIESYEPEAYYEKFPEMTIRKAFINCRELFLATWKNNCH